MKKHAALYLRSSKDRKDVSPDAQRRALLELASNRGETVVQEFLDTVESGKDENRPAFQQLIKAVRNPDRGWDTLLLYDTARLSRRRVISLIFEEVDCKRNGVQVVYKSLPDLDPLTEMLLKSILQAWDEYHSISSKQKGLAGMSENVRAGFRAGGRAPTGYRLKKVGTGAIREGEAVTKSTLEPDPETAAAIAAYLRDRAAGVARAAAVANAGLRGMKDPTLVGIEWNALTYAGHTVWNVHAERQGGAYVGGEKRRPRTEWVIQRDTHPPLITEHEAEQLLGQLEVKAMARKANAKTQRARESSAILGGLLFAPDGTKWWAERDRYRWDQPGHPQRSISRAAIEEPVLDQVLSDLTSPNFAQVLLDGAKASLAGDVDTVNLRKVRGEISAISTRISKTLDMATELADPAPALRKVDELERSRSEKLLQLRELEAEAERAANVANISVAYVQRVLADLAEQAKENDRSELRSSFLSLIERVELDPSTLDAVLHYRIVAPDSGVRVASPRGRELNPRLTLRHRVRIHVVAPRQRRLAA